VSEAIRFVSTRDPEGREVAFAEAFLRGLAPDGGLYLPTRVPRLPDGWSERTSLPELGLSALAPWLGDGFGEDALAEILRDALDFPLRLHPLGEGLWVLELFHGPTLSFKDVGARVMARLMNHLLRERNERRTIVVATSGDTGSAVADGFAGQERIEVVLLYPQGKVSPVQERQLVVARPGVRAFAVAGDFDDCQRLAKAALADPALVELELSSANSINIGRLLPQMLYYLWASAEFAGRQLMPPCFCVPSGNLGNLTAGMLAGEMGMPARGFIAAHNANRYFPHFLVGGAEAFAFAKTVATLSNAMDVGAPSNFERLFHLFGEGLKQRVWGTSVGDEATKLRLKRTFEATGYVACPHTAVGLEAASRYREQGGSEALVVLATAHPAKFPEVVEEALGIAVPRHEALEALWARPTRVEALEPDLEALREALLA
jgi:threonine synthase